MKLEQFVLTRGISLAQVDNIRQKLEGLPDNTINLRAGVLEVGEVDGHIIINGKRNAIFEVHIPESSKEVMYNPREKDMDQISFNYKGQRYAIQASR